MVARSVWLLGLSVIAAFVYTMSWRPQDRSTAPNIIAPVPRPPLHGVPLIEDEAEVSRDENVLAQGDAPTNRSWHINQLPGGTLAIVIDPDYFSRDETIPTEQLSIPFVSLSDTTAAATSDGDGPSASGIGTPGRRLTRLTAEFTPRKEEDDDRSDQTLADNRQTYQQLRRRGARISEWRMGRLFAATSAEVGGRRSARAVSLEWATGLLLLLWASTGEDMFAPNDCTAYWRKEAALFRRGAPAALVDVLRCVAPATTGNGGSDNDTAERCSEVAERCLTFAYGDPSTTRQLLLRTEHTQVLPRRLQEPLVDFSGEQSVANLQFLRTHNWSSPTPQNRYVATHAWPIRSVRPPAVPDDSFAVREGVCYAESSKFQFFPLTAKRRAQLRVLMRLDVSDVLLMRLDHKQPQTTTNNRAEDITTTSTSSSDVGCSMASLVEANRLVSFMRRTRWMFDTYVPLFLNESAAYTASAPPRTQSTTTGIDTAHSHGSPPGGSGMTAEQWSEAVNASFRIEASRPVLSKAGSYKLSQLLSPLHYEINNICVSPSGFGLSGYAAPSLPPPRLPTDMRDERRNRVRQLGIRRRSTMPRHFVDVPLFLSVVQYQSDNLGHVLYRHGAHQNLMRDAWSSAANRARVPLTGDPDDYVVAYVVIPNAAGSYGERTSLRHFYQAFNQSWMSVSTTAPPSEGGLPVDADDEEVCFRKAWMGHDALFMYHSVGTSPPMRKRYLQSAQGSQRKVQTYFTFLRRRLQLCMLDPLRTLLIRTPTQNTSMLRGWVQNVAPLDRPSYALPKPQADHPIQVLVVQRRLRRLGNLNRLLGAIAVFYGAVSTDGNRTSPNFQLLDRNFSKREIVVNVVDVQDLPTAHQVALFAAADILVGVHGTAFQWMMLMRRSSVVVELQYPGLGCVSAAVMGDGGSPYSRLFCEFGKTSVATQLTHIAHMTTNVFGDSHPTKFNIIVEVPVFVALFEAALCSLHVGVERSTQFCTRHYYPVR